MQELYSDDDFLKSLKVLYVEDEPEVRAMLAKFLSRRFRQVDVAENGKMGLEMFISGSYDIVITDVKMPVIVQQHHERMDGSGYPKWLKGDEIALEARIVCVADVVEAISSHRPYRPALGLEAAKEELIC